MLEGRQVLEKYETLRTYEIHISQMLCQVSSGLSLPLQHLGCPDEAGFPGQSCLGGAMEGARRTFH